MLYNMIVVIKRFLVCIIRMISNVIIFPSIRMNMLKLSGLKIGEKAFVNMGFHVVDNYENLIEIGDRVAIAPNVHLVAVSNPNYSILSKIEKYCTRGRIKIGDDSWLGVGVVVLPGVTIGKCCIVGSNAVVSKDIDDYSIVAGIPAKKIGETKEYIV
jgi:acetyltransferase-like isoleucine patch superfamily enzyme